MTLEIREREDRGDRGYLYEVVPRQKGLFKLRSNIEKKVVITARQISTNSCCLNVERCFGMLVSPGRAVRHAAIKDRGGAVIRYIRVGLGPEPLPGWRRVDVDGVALLEGPNGERCATEQDAHEYEQAVQFARTGIDQSRAALSFLQKLLNDSLISRK